MPEILCINPFKHTLPNILNILIYKMWKKDKNFPVKIQVLCHCLIDIHKLREKFYLQELMPVNSIAQRVQRSRVMRVYSRVYAKRAKRTLHSWVLVQLVYALLAGHKRYTVFMTG